MENIDRSKQYINPYLGGVLLGLLLLATFFVTGRGLGASGAIKSSVAATVNTINPERAQEEEYLGQFITDDKNPLSNWLVYEVLGIIIGAFLSGSLAGRLKWKVEHSPKIATRTRIFFALGGGFLFGIGFSAGTRMYQRRRPEWLCRFGYFRFPDHAEHFWIRLPVCVFLPQTLDIKWCRILLTFLTTQKNKEYGTINSSRRN
jgi:hypothetical protein